MRRAAIVGTAVVAVAATGCGGSSDEDAARDAVKEYAEAIADRDGRRACESLARAARAQFERSKVGCEAAYRAFGRALDRRQREMLEEIDPDMNVDGNEASTRVDEPPLEGELRLRKEGGDWKVVTR
jgi:hypothetical protein